MRISRSIPFFLFLVFPFLVSARGLVDPSLGPTIGGEPIHVYVDLLASFVALVLMVKMGRGQLKYPIFVFVIGYLTSAFITLLGGVDLAWLVPLVKSMTDFIGLFWIFGILSGFTMFRGRG